MVLQPTGRTAGRHHCLRGGLLPRLFTLTGRKFRIAGTPPCGTGPCPDAFTGGYFLLRSHDLTAIKSLACVVLCVARTFLPRPTAGSDRADLRGKDRDFSGNSCGGTCSFRLLPFVCIGHVGPIASQADSMSIQVPAPPSRKSRFSMCPRSYFMSNESPRAGTGV